MAKGKLTTCFYCTNCGNETSKWMGQCPFCKEWNTLVEETVSKPSTKSNSNSVFKPDDLKSVSQIVFEENERMTTGFRELDRVLGGGIVPGSLVLVGGDPGIGKSTILLQVVKSLSDAACDVIYISGEESPSQIKMRALRIGDFNDNLKLLCETNLTVIEDVLRKKKPDCVVIDSIQTMVSEDVSSAAGSVSQVREATAILMKLAKSLSISIFIVGHVTKEGTVAGPRVLEHMVDTVLYFEGDRYASYRLIRAVKNRFGSTNEVGVFEMRKEGLVEVNNPSEYMLSGRPTDISGNIAVCAMEGTRPILMEIQALVTKTSFGLPRRQATGCDYNRVNLLMAVLEKRIGLKLFDCDAYVNVAGGIKLSEPAIDLGICICIISAFENIVIDKKTVAFGEVGLAGEVRSVSQCESRVAEAIKMGFERIIIPKSSLSSLHGEYAKNVIGVENVRDVIKIIKNCNL